MNYIRQAVELADGFDPSPLQNQQPFLDALAAQLTRQVDAISYYECVSHPIYTRITQLDDVGLPKHEWYGKGPDRTMNTIRAIIDSGVLK